MSYPSPAECPGEIVPRAQREHADRRPRADAVEHAQHPAHGAIAAARQHTEIWHFSEQF